MSLVTANDVGVISGTVIRPLVGVWVADLIIDQPDGSGFAAGTKVTIKADGGYTLKGVVDPDRTGSFLDSVHVRVVGGAGGLGKDASPRSYVQPSAFVRDVLNGLCNDAGETLSSTTSPAFLLKNLTAWSVIGGNSVRQNLRALLDIVAPDMSLRILSDGTLWVGEETWPQSSATYDVMNQDPTDGSYLIGMDSPFVEPGTNLPDVGNVGRVMDTIDKGRLRSRIWIDFPGLERGSSAAIQSIAKQAIPRVDYYALYVFQVVSQSADLATVDISPVGDRNKALLGGLQRVTARYLTGTKVQVSPGATCLLGWDGGNPEGPYALVLSGDGAIKVAVSATNVDIHADAQLTASGATATLSATGTVTVSANGAAALKGSSTQLGINPIKTPVITVGAFDGLGIPITNSPLNTGTVLAG